MPEYQFGDTTVRRKHTWLPCIIGERFDAMSEEEQAAACRSTYWADNITNGEWPVVLRHDGVKAYVRSRLKKKAVGWCMALARLAVLNPQLFAEITEKADEMYREQIEEDSFELQTLRSVGHQAAKAEVGETLFSQVWRERIEEGDCPERLRNMREYAEGLKAGFWGDDDG
jgi:hypothetical protein